MGTTKIQWAEKVLSDRHVFKNHPVYKSRIACKIVFFNEVKNIHRSLTRITSMTTWHDVPRDAFPALRYRKDMIPCVGYFSAIGALAVKFFKQHFLRFRRDRFNAALARMSVLFSFSSAIGICFVFVSCVFIPVISTHPPPNNFNAHPFFAFSAPRQPQPLFSNSLSASWTFSGGVITLHTPPTNSIATSNISIKYRFVQPLLANIAMPHPLLMELPIFIERQTITARRLFQCSEFCLCHCILVSVYKHTIL